MLPHSKAKMWRRRWTFIVVGLVITKTTAAKMRQTKRKSVPRYADVENETKLLFKRSETTNSSQPNVNDGRNTLTAV